jgi:hypothetical protein
VTPRVNAWAIITVLATGIGSSSGHVTPPAATASSMVNQTAHPRPSPGFHCPVTIPRRPGFRPPPGYPRRAPFDGKVWYGSSGLWTILNLNGEPVGTKMPLWWSVRFPGGSDEPRPNVRVRWIRIGSNREPSVIDQRGWTTNGLTPETGWLMMAGAFPRTDVRGACVLNAGCWKVEATYKGSTLTYVIELPGWRSEPAGAAPIKRVRSGSIPNRAQYALMTGSAHTPAWS